jgi:hypothetical protein
MSAFANCGAQIEAFSICVVDLSELGCNHVVSPIEIGMMELPTVGCPEYLTFLSQDLRVMDERKINTIVFIPPATPATPLNKADQGRIFTWLDSNGARAEAFVGIAQGMAFYQAQYTSPEKTQMTFTPIPSEQIIAELKPHLEKSVMPSLKPLYRYYPQLEGKVEKALAKLR